MASMKAHVPDLSIIPRMFTNSVFVTPLPETHVDIGQVMDDPDELAKKDCHAGAGSVDDHAYHLLKVVIECGSLRQSSRKPASMKRHDAHNTCAKKKIAEKPLARDVEGEMCTPQRKIFTQQIIVTLSRKQMVTFGHLLSPHLNLTQRRLLNRGASSEIFASLTDSIINIVLANWTRTPGSEPS